MTRPIIDETHEPARSSWVTDANGHPDFPVQNLPLGVFSAGGTPRGGIAIGDHVLDLPRLSQSGLLDEEALAAAEAASGPTLNPLLALGARPRLALRRAVSVLLSNPTYRDVVGPLLHPIAACALHLPAAVGDYTDFYVGIHHATNVGRIFRPGSPLLPNYKHIPIGYHGRASTIRASGADVFRPKGQSKADDGSAPVLAESRQLDYELELGVWIGCGNDLGCPIPINRAHEHVAGLTLLNDWSARDIQAWEYQPLGPFLAKSFLTTVSPWIVTTEALAPFFVAQPGRGENDPAPLPYLLDPEDQAAGALAIDLQVFLQSARMKAECTAPLRLSEASAGNMYWTIAQMIAHHTINGCNLRSGDVLGTGTVSGADPSGFGSLLELTVGGTRPLTLPSGETRSFLEDGDSILLSGAMRREGFVSIGFGPCHGTICPSAGQWLQDAAAGPLPTRPQA